MTYPEVLKVTEEKGIKLDTNAEFTFELPMLGFGKGHGLSFTNQEWRYFNSIFNR